MVTKCLQNMFDSKYIGKAHVQCSSARILVHHLDPSVGNGCEGRSNASWLH